MTARTTEFCARMHSTEELIKHLYEIANELVGKPQVRLLTGKYVGRIGCIIGVLPHPRHGLIYLVMVQRSNSLEYLNSDVESRSYRPRKDFEIL